MKHAVFAFATAMLLTVGCTATTASKCAGDEPSTSAGGSGGQPLTNGGTGGDTTTTTTETPTETTTTTTTATDQLVPCSTENKPCELGGVCHLGFCRECPFQSQCDPTLPPTLGKGKCDDQNSGTIDRCILVPNCGGICVRIPGACDAFDDSTIQDIMCNDANPCTDDHCSGDNVCFHTPEPDGKPCPLGKCTAGVCGD